jgi:pilus assembly protein CpaD
MNLVFKSLMVAGALVVAGCASTSEPRPHATAAAETVRVSMDVSAIDNGLTWNQIDVIEAVATEYKARGHGPLVISYPQNAGNADAAIGAIAEARTRLYAAGLDWRQIAGGAYEAGGRVSAPVIFSFTRYQAIAPECSTEWNDMARARPGETWPRFGCATANNLASMVADPRDLVAPRTMDAPDSARRQGVLDNYRQGRSTASERSDRESGAISSSVGN